MQSYAPLARGKPAHSTTKTTVGKAGDLARTTVSYTGQRETNQNPQTPSSQNSLPFRPFRMRGKGNQVHEEEEYEDEEFGSRKEGPSWNVTANNNTNTGKDGKNSDKANAIRSKHSVTEQRRRSKINERFQILRELVPNSDQKRDTASFLLEVIEYVQFLQEKVQKYEGPYQGWSTEPTKLMPWRNSHWRVQSFAGHPQAIKNGSGPGSTFPGKLADNNIAITPAMPTSSQNPVESDGEATCKTMEQQPGVLNKGLPLTMPMHSNLPVPVQSDGSVAHLHQPLSDVLSAECPVTSDAHLQELVVEGGTISVSSAYSQGLLNTLTEALQNAGLDLSQANISVQIDLGNRANRGLMSAMFTSKDHPNATYSNPAVTHLREAGSGEDSNQAQKRLKS